MKEAQLAGGKKGDSIKCAHAHGGVCVLMFTVACVCAYVHGGCRRPSRF